MIEMASLCCPDVAPFRLRRVCESDLQMANIARLSMIVTRVSLLQHGILHVHHGSVT